MKSTLGSFVISFLGPHCDISNDQGFDVSSEHLLLEGRSRRVELQEGRLGVDHNMHTAPGESPSDIARRDLGERGIAVIEVGLGLALEEGDSGLSFGDPGAFRAAGSDSEVDEVG